MKCGRKRNGRCPVGEEADQVIEGLAVAANRKPLSIPTPYY